MKKGFGVVSHSQLVKASWNYKTEDFQLSQKLKKNMARNGQIENIIVRELENGFLKFVMVIIDMMLLKNWL